MSNFTPHNITPPSQLITDNSFIALIKFNINAIFSKNGVVKLKDDPNQLGTEITLIAGIALHLSYSDLTTPKKSTHREAEKKKKEKK
ncbi:hypothetical protein RVR34_02285 [Microcystis aeruginosa FBCC-A68]|uniref:hypothetical protein n=1 Tax=Microcystis aeruginosa TaxID=1126 RepID=UPI001482DF7B|nr:hypothetical protein [Microcystis aeruginosa]